MAHDGWRGGGRKGEAGPPARQGGREGSEGEREAGGQGPPRNHSCASEQPQGQSPVTLRIQSLGKSDREARGGPAGARGWRPRKQHLRGPGTRHRGPGGTESKPPSEVEKRRAEGTEGGTDRSLRRKEEGERGQARRPRRRRAAGGCRQEAGDRTCCPSDPRRPPLQAEAPVVRPGCASEGHC